MSETGREMRDESPLSISITIKQRKLSNCEVRKYGLDRQSLWGELCLRFNFQLELAINNLLNLTAPSLSNCGKLLARGQNIIANP